MYIYIYIYVYSYIHIYVEWYFLIYHIKGNKN